ncbi:TraE/TraK family type IV conjugative transfer system protein [Maricaulis virginensis]|nr:TraE/TraK family type IV conjugative transfer system protein [Maricaulis virginensis]
MDIGEATGRVRSISRVTAMLACLCLALTVAVIALALSVMAKRGEVVLVPTLSSELRMISGTPSAEYMEAMTRDVAALMLNRHPNNTEYFRENILRMVHASVYAQIERELDAARQERVRTRTSTVFHPVSIYVDPEDRYSEITGILRTYVGPEQVGEETKTFAVRWIVEGLTVRLADFSEIERANSRAR